MVRERRRENKNTCEYEREGCFKSCQTLDVQISFLFKQFWFLFLGLKMEFYSEKENRRDNGS